MKFLKDKIYLFLITIFVLSSFFSLSQFVFATDNVSVEMTVPSDDTGSGGDSTSPIITNIASLTTQTTAEVTWTATDNVNLVGCTFAYGQNYSSSTIPTNVDSAFTANISSLTSNTSYDFQITCTDSSGNSKSEVDVFITKGVSDENAPNIFDVVIDVGITTTSISWTTSENANEQINYGFTTAYGSSYEDINNYTINHQVLLGSDTLALLPNTTYHFQILASDSSGNSSGSEDYEFTTLKDQIPPPNVTGLTVISNNASLVVNWINPSLVNYPDFVGVKVIRKVGSFSSSITDGVEVYDGAGQTYTDVVSADILYDTEYFYTVFSYDTSENYSTGVADSGVVSFFEIERVCGNGVLEIGEECDDGEQNGPICETSCSLSCAINDNSNCGSGDSDKVRVLNFNNLIFKAGNRLIDLIPNNRTVTSLNDSFFSILISTEFVNGEPDFLILNLDGAVHQFSIDEENELYFLDISFPIVGLHQSYIEGIYEESNADKVSLESVLLNLSSLEHGVISSKDISSLENVKVTLFKDVEKFETGIYGQANSVNTNAQGFYGWVVPNGNYYLEIEKFGYYERKTQVFAVTNNVINNDLSLILKPENIIDIIDPEAPIEENIKKVIDNINEKTKVIIERTIQIFQETVDNPIVENVVEEIIAPVAIGVVALSALPSLWFNLLNLLRFLFLQPLLLFGRRKRKGWGQVYNSLNKMPIDLATVRLIDVATNRVVQSRVTDKNGRFIFSVKQGKYKLEAHKHGFIFPSALLANIKEDGKRLDIYHGEEINVTEDGIFITPNIPFDPVDEKVKHLSRIKWEKFSRSLQFILSWFGLIVTVISLYISPVWYMWVLLAMHLFVFFIFRRIVTPKKPKGWGVVYDYKNKKPIGKVIARLFDSKFNKLISTQVTDKKGRYAFLAGDNKYYVKFEHKKYLSKNSAEIDLINKEEEIVAVDINLKKKN